MRYIAPVLCLLVASCGQPYDVPVDSEGRCFNIPVVDEGNLSGRPQQGQQGSQAQPAPVAPQSSTAAPSSDAKATVREYVRKLMDVPRQVAASVGHNEETRGGPGCSSALSAEQLDEFAAAIIFAGDHFLPSHLKPEQKWALVAVEISAESAFKVGTAGANPGDMSMTSVGPLQWTKEIWTPIFRRQPPIEGLVHYDGGPWLPSDTTDQMMINSIWDNVVGSTYVIMQQGRQGAPDNIGGPDGPAPKTVQTAHYCWVLGAPAARSGQDLANQRQHYRNCESADLRLLGFEEALLDAAF